MVIAALKTALYPFMPHASERLHALMGFSAPLVDSGWSLTPPPAGQALATPTPLFTKLDEGTVERETAIPGSPDRSIGQVNDRWKRP